MLTLATAMSRSILIQGRTNPHLKLVQDIMLNHCANEDNATEAHSKNIPKKKVIHRNLSDLAKDLDNITLNAKEDQDELLRDHTYETQVTVQNTNNQRYD